MNPKALVVEDDPQIVEVIEDYLVSLGHEYVWVNNLHDARTKLAAEDFTYVLLDLEFPAKPKSNLASKESGALLLEEIQQLKGFEKLPVIVMSGHTGYCLNRSNEFRDQGAFEFIGKPFPTESHTLPSVIRAALKSQKRDNRQRPKGEPRPFDGGDVILYSNRIEICGVDILVSKMMRKVLGALNATRPTTGNYVAYPGSELADLVGCERGQNGVAELFREFRDRTAERLLEEANVICGRFAIVQSGGPGYRFNPWLTVKTVDGAVQVASADEIEPPDDVTENDRQAWILSELEKGGEIRVGTVAARFGCSPATAKRELAELRKRKLIRFEGPAKTGAYRLVGRRPLIDRRAARC